MAMISLVRRLLPAVCLLAGLAACTDGSPTVDPPAQYISVRRAWLPGERDSLVAAVQAGHLWVFPGVGDLSPYIDQILPLDSVYVMVSNPAFNATSSALAGFSADVRLSPQWNTSWTIYGTDVWSINNTQAPPDTVRWLGVFWWNPAESNWKGWAIAASKSNVLHATLPQTSVNNTTFDAAGGKAGAAAGEFRSSDKTEWEATGVGSAPTNTMSITSSAGYSAPTTMNTGPFLGGTLSNGTVQGRLRAIPIQRLATSIGQTAPANQSVDLDFSAGMNAAQIICKFKNPCTTNTP